MFYLLTTDTGSRPNEDITLKVETSLNSMLILVVNN